MDDQPYLSLVIPCYNEQENVDALLARVSAALEKLGKPFEVLIIDDGSTDNTPTLLLSQMQQHTWLRVLRMARNGGQSAAFEAGFIAARGQIIATIDADLQNDPEEIPRLLPMLDQDAGYDMITGWRKDRQDTNFRRFQSRQANRIRNWISQDDIHDSASSLKIYRAPDHPGFKTIQRRPPLLPRLSEDARRSGAGDAGKAFPPLRRHREIRLSQPRVPCVHRSAWRAVDEDAVSAISGRRNAARVTSRPYDGLIGSSAASLPR